MKTRLRTKKRQTPDGLDRENWSINRMHEHIHSLVHVEELLNQLSSEIKYGLKIELLFINQTCAKIS